MRKDVSDDSDKLAEQTYDDDHGAADVCRRLERRHC
jgi:hypothetical protein